MAKYVLNELTSLQDRLALSDRMMGRLLAVERNHIWRITRGKTKPGKTLAHVIRIAHECMNARTLKAQNETRITVTKLLRKGLVELAFAALFSIGTPHA